MKTPRFLSRLFRPETKGLADPGPDIWRYFGIDPAPEWIGVAMSPETALRQPAVASAVRLISEAAACLPARIMRRNPDGTLDEAPDHAANEFLAVRANDWTSPFELIRDLVIDALTDDRGGMAHVGRGGSGAVVEVIRYRSGVMQCDFDQITGEPSYRLENRPVSRADVLHLRSPFGKSPLTLARDAIAVAYLLERHAAQLFKNGARPSGALKFPKGMGEESVKKAREMWRATHESGTTGRTAILYDEADFVPITFNSTDAQFLENRNFQILEIARHFRVPPSMLFQLDRATWGNTEQLGKEFLTTCLGSGLVLVS